jgi:diguanylate cyclase (GGDEF)-like protein
MFDPVLEKIGEKEESLVPRFSLDKEYLVVCGKKDTVPVTADRVDRKEIIPDNTGEGANTIYLVGILHYEDLMCGYIVSGTSAREIRDGEFANYQTRLDRAFFTYIKNLQLNTLNKKLADLMEQDSLTHVKNRTAYDKYIRSFQHNVYAGDIKEYAVAYFDINDLKVINDKYGHEAGDAYIRNSCKLICETFKRSPVFRIGGDEFLCILSNGDYEHRDQLLDSMKKEMEKRREEREKYSPAAIVSIASGLAVFDPEKDEDIMTVVHRADALMYENKAHMKRGNIR